MTKKIIAIAASAVVLAVSIVLLIVLLPKTPDTVNSNRLLLSASTKTVYQVGDEFVPPVVVLIHENGKEEDVSSSEFLTISGYDLQQKGSYTVHVSYACGNVKASSDYKIEVRSNVVTDIKVDCRQDTLIWGERIDRNNITVTAFYDDNRKDTVEDYVLTYNYEPEEYGPVGVKVSYKGVEKVFTINVVGESIDAEYKALEDEAKRILIALGIENPSSPRDYLLEFYVNGKAKVTFAGDFNDGMTEQEQIFGCISIIFQDYTVSGEIEDSYEMIFPSKKIVFIHEEKQIQASVYLTTLLGKNKYSIVIEELITEA